MRTLIKFAALTLALACAGGDELVEHEELGQLEQSWCIGCQAGVTTPRSIAVGYGLQPITQTVGSQSVQFPACYGTEASMPHNCRTPTGNAIWFAAPPSSWGPGRTGRYWDAVETMGTELSNAGWAWGAAWNGNVDPWDTGSNRYKHTEIIVKNDITTSPHPLFRLALQGVQNTPYSRVKTYLACEIEFDFVGPKGIANNGGWCTGNCADNWSPTEYDQLRQTAFLRALSRCVGLGGDGIQIHEYDVGAGDQACWAADGWSCAQGGGDGMTRREWFPAGWWEQRYWKNCLGNSPQAACNGIWPQPLGSGQYLSGSALLWEYLH